MAVSSYDGLPIAQVASLEQQDPTASWPVRHVTPCLGRFEVEHPGPRSRAALRRGLRVNNQRLGDALLDLQRRGLVARNRAGWHLPCPLETAT